MKNPCSRRFHFFRSTALPAAFFVHFAASSAFAVPYYWDTDGATAGFGTAAGIWAAPTTGDATQGWSTDSTGATLPGNVTTTTGDILNFGTSTVPLAAGTISITGTVDANRLVLAGSTSGPFTFSGGTIVLGGTSPSIIINRGGQIIGSALTLNANTSIVVGTSGLGMADFNGAIAGSGNLTITTGTATNGSTGSNTGIDLGAASTYTGSTLITSGKNDNVMNVRAFVDNALPATTVLTLSGGVAGSGSGRQISYDLAGNDQTLAGLANVTLAGRPQRILNSTGTGTLTINNTSPASSSFGGNINGTGLSLAKTGTGTQTLTAGNTLTGTTTVTGGKLIGVVGGNLASSKVVINNILGTFGISVTDNTKTWTVKELAPTAAGTVEFNFGAVDPSTTVSPLTITVATLLTGLADFTAATPKIQVNVDTGLLPGTYPLMTWDTVSGTVPTTADLTVSNIAGGTTPSLSVTGNTLNLVISSTATSVVKANNADNLNLGSSWVGGTAPDSTKIAKWNNTVTSANSTVLGTDATWAGIAVENPAGPVTINAGNILTVGAAVLDIDLSTATRDLTLNCPLRLADSTLVSIAALRNVTLGGQVSGAFGIETAGAGTATLSSAANNYTGNTIVSSGTLKLGASQVIPNGAATGNVSVDGTLDLNGNSETVNGLTGTGIIDNALAATSPVLTASANNQTSTFNGVIQNTAGTLNLTKTGNGTLTLGGANTLTGVVSVTGGTLAFTNIDPFANASGISLAGATNLRPAVSGSAISAPITVGASGTSVTITAPDVPGSGTTQFAVTLGGVISGDGNLILSGVSNANSYGRIDLNAASTYAGSTLMTNPTGLPNTNIFVRLGVDNALPVTTVLTLDGGDGTGGSGRFCELNLNGKNQTLAGLTNVPGRVLRTQEIYNTSATASTLTVNNTDPFTYAALIGGGASGNNLGLTKSGSGTFTISGANTYTGATTITGGTLALGALNTLPDASPVSIGAGTLSAVTAGTESTGTLQVTGTAVINLGTDAVLAIADSSTVAWTGNLNLTGTFVSGTSLRFGDGTGTGLTPAQLASISATGYTGFALNGSGFLTATPSGGGFASWITGTFAGGTIPVDKRGPNDDFDNDGISNLVEYAVDGQDPTLPNANIGTYSANTLSFTKRAGSSGLTYAIQDSTDLGVSDPWSEVIGGSYVNNATTISATLTPGTPAKNFLRLQVISN
jgi:fibronectin-binding autotransporter adhesin